MSVFNKVIEINLRAKTDAEQAAAAAAEARQTVEKQFAAEFHIQIEAIAKPIFDKFIVDAIAYGFPAKTEFSDDGNSNPSYSLIILPELGSQFGLNTSKNCVFKIEGKIASQKVEYVSYYDQRPHKNGIKRQEFGIQSINKTLLERELSEFLTSAINARAV